MSDILLNVIECRGELKPPIWEFYNFEIYFYNDDFLPKVFLNFDCLDGMGSSNIINFSTCLLLK
jgi:hypothetical protein